MKILNFVTLEIKHTKNPFSLVLDDNEVEIIFVWLRK